MINCGGEKVNPQEVDDVLMSHPAVAQAASFAVPHRTLGDDVMVAVVLNSSDRIGERELRNFVAERLSAYKVPRRVIFLGRLPQNRTGKVDGLVLSEMAVSALA
jgi:acyl-CoA synthetase (AMP-forming)/AMP-acid ligase II